MTTDDIIVCFITAYLENKTTEENEIANNSLGDDIRKLGYVYFKVSNGYKIMVNKYNSKNFIEEIKALGKKYNQPTVLIRVGNDELLNITDEEYKILLEKTNNECGIKSMSGSGWVVRGYTRQRLGLK